MTMKNIEQLATDVSTTLVTDILPKRILEQVDVAARAFRRADALVKVNRDLVGAKGRSIIVPQRGQLTAAAVTEGISPTTASVTYTGVTISPSKIGVGVRISQEAITGIELDVINDLINEAGEAMAQKEDIDIIAKFTAANAVYTTLNGEGSITASNLMAAKTSVLAQNYIPTILFINPTEQSDILLDTTLAVIDTSKYGDREPILNGEIGKVLGLKVIMSQNCPTGKALVVDPTKAAIEAIKTDVYMKRKDEASTDSVELYFYKEYGASMLNAKAAAIITNA